MMKKTLLFCNNGKLRSFQGGWQMLLLLFTLLLVSPSMLANDLLSAGDSNTLTVDGGTITGGPFSFCVGDGIEDNVAGVKLECNNTVNSQWVVTDESGKILGLPPSPEAVNFDGAGAGVCLIWHLSYADGLEGLDAGNNVSGLVGEHDFSNSIKVYRSQTEAGTLTGGPFEFAVDGTPDMVSGIAITGERSGKNSTFLVTSPEGEILGVPPSLEAVEGIDFDGAGAGTCLIWHLRYEDGLEGLEMGMNANDLSGCYDLSNYVEVVRREGTMAKGGELTGGPFEFCVGDDIEDHVFGVAVSGNTGANSQWVVTDESGKILGLPPSPEAVNFDGAGAGVCLIWHLSYADGLEGLDAGNNVSGLVGEHDFSNSIKVYRSQPEAGTLTGGPFEFAVDGTPDMVSGIAITGERSGKNSTFLVTSPEGEILGVPPSLTAVEGIDFDGAGAGTCLIWHLRYEDGLEGLEMGMNANDLSGCYDLSNYVEVVRKENLQIEEATVKLFPNPAVDVLKVLLPAFSFREVQVSLFDVTGNAIKNGSRPLIDNGLSLNVRTVPAGLYLLRVSQADGKSVTKKVVIR